MRRAGKSRIPMYIGIDVGARSIKVAQLSMSGGKLRIAALSMLPRTKIAEQVDTEEILKIRRILRRQGFHGNDIVLASPENGLLRGVFDVPPQVSGPGTATPHGPGSTA